jgi:hypothetical protein
MIELTIKGTTVHELLNNAGGVLALLVNGAQAIQQAREAAGIEPPSPNPNPKDETLVTDTPAPPKPRGRPRKPSAPIETKDVVLNDDPNFDAGEQTPKAVAPPANGENYTLDDDIRPRLRAVIKKKENALKAMLPVDQQASVMGLTTAFVVDTVFKPFGVAQISKLKPEYYDAFMIETEQYL